MFSNLCRIGIAAGLCIAAAALDSASPAHATTVNSAVACKQSEDPHLAVRACSVLISHPQIDRQNRAAALTLRSAAHERIGNLRQAFKDAHDALRLEPGLPSARAQQLLVADTLNKQCTPWPAERGAQQAIDACSIVIDEGGEFYSPARIGRARVDRGLLLKTAGRPADAIVDFRAVAQASSGAAAGDVARAEEEIRAIRK